MPGILIYNIFKQQHLMDQEDFIKIEHESPIKAGDNFANYYLTQFYDQDSIQEHSFIKKEDASYTQSVSSQEVSPFLFQLIEKVCQELDLRTTSLENIISYAKENFIFNEQINWIQFQRKIKKKKMMMKRAFAKSRQVQVDKNQYYVFGDTVEGVDIKEQIQAEIKKKRNRMSAQISRDRKKIQIQELQENNKKLKEETEKMFKENQRLKQQLEEFNRAEEKKVEASKGKNKFLALLIMFGMLFLMTILRDSGKPSPIKISGKIEKEHGEVLSASEQTKIVEGGQKLFENLQETGQLLGSKKAIKNVMNKLEQIKSSVEDVIISKTLKKELEQIQRHVN